MCATDYNSAALFTPTGAHIDNTIGGTDDIKVMLDHNNRCPLGNQRIKHLQQRFDIPRVKAVVSAQFAMCPACQEEYSDPAAPALVHRVGSVIPDACFVPQMGNIVRNPRIWIPPTLASAITGPIATCIFQLKMNGPAISSGMGTCGLVGPIGVYTGWVADMASGAMTAITAMDWAGLVLICFVLPAALTYAFGLVLRKIGWIKEGDLTLESADDMVKGSSGTNAQRRRQHDP